MWHPSSVPRFERIPGNDAIGRVKVYDAGGTGERYTVVFVDLDRHLLPSHRYAFLGMNATPTHPAAGISQWGECEAGPHLGRRIPFAALPADIQKHVIARTR